MYFGPLSATCAQAGPIPQLPQTLRRELLRGLNALLRPDQVVWNHEQVMSLAMVTAAATASSSDNKSMLVFFMRASPPFRSVWLQ